MNVKRLLKVVGVGALLIFLLASATYYFDLITFRRFFYQPVRETVYFLKELGLPAQWRQIHVVRAQKGEIVTISSGTQEQIKLAGELRFPATETKAPAILLLHGSAPWGRKAGLIQLMATRYQDLGWVVLTPDARGFGDSDDPEDPSALTAWEPETDVRNWIDYLSNHPRVDSNNIVVIGHSFGAGQALAGALGDKRVAALILIGPSRYLHNSTDAPSEWQLARYSADRGLAEPISINVVNRLRNQLDIQTYLEGPLSEEGHNPILLLDGELEGKANLAFLSDIARKIKPPIVYYTLPNTGHYCGVINLYGSSLIFYNSNMFEPFFLLVADFINNNLSVDSL